MKNVLVLILVFGFSSSAWCQTQIFWSDPVDIAPADYGNFYPRIQVNGAGGVFVSWGSTNNIYFAKSIDQGFTDPIKVNNDTTKAYVASWTGADLAVQEDMVYIGFMHKDWGKKSYIIASDDSGETFSNPRLIENYPDSTSRFPSITIDPDGNPIVAIMKMTTNGQDPHYVVRKSFDQGETFNTEFNSNIFSGPESEACDCCPASIISLENKTSLLFRNNINNLREIWAVTSENSGLSFDAGFKVDNSGWQISSCPSSGPDGFLLDGMLYSTYLSDSKCYLSQVDLNTQEIITIEQLGESPVEGFQNFPRISNYGSLCGITWKGINFGQKLMVSYTTDISSESFVHDTISNVSFSSSDIAVYQNNIHLVWEDNSTGTVRYMNGTILSTSNKNLDQEELLVISPNPADLYL